MGEHHREDRDHRADPDGTGRDHRLDRDESDRGYRGYGGYRAGQAGRARTSRSQTVRSRSRGSRSGTVRSRTTARDRYYQLPANLRAASDPPPATGSTARHRLARARHGLARAGYRVVRPRGGNTRLPTPIEALLPWGPVLVGIGILIGLMISVFVVPASHVAPPGLPNLAIPPTAPHPTQAPPAQNPDEGPRYLVPEAYEVQYSPTPASPSESPPPPPPPEAELAGTYKLEEVYEGVFIAAVEIVNESAVAGGWTVELDYGPDVGGPNTFWVDGTPQPSLEFADDRFVFTSAVDVPPEASVTLKVHFDKFGFDISPKTCLVNGADCTIVDPWFGHGG